MKYWQDGILEARINEKKNFSMSWDNVHLVKFCFSFVTLNFKLDWICWLQKLPWTFKPGEIFESSSLKNLVMKKNDYLQMDTKILWCRCSSFTAFHCCLYYISRVQTIKKFCSLLNITGLSSVFWRSGNLCFQ